MSRSFYVGNAITQDDIKAKYESGILRLSVPKKAADKLQRYTKVVEWDNGYLVMAKYKNASL